MFGCSDPDPLLTSLNYGVGILRRGPQVPINKTVEFPYFENNLRNLLVVDSISQLTHDPRTVEDLTRFSKVANELYAQIPRPSADSEGEALKTRTAIDDWVGDLQQKLYDTRDRMLQQKPAALDHFSISRQYQDLTGQTDVPNAIRRVDDQVGTVLFTGHHVRNDCGVFANRLYEKVKALVVDETLKSLENELSVPGATLSPEHVTAIRNSLSNVNRVKLDYENASWNHHVKTQIGTDTDGKIITWEAHTGRPFMLAPELNLCRNQQEFLEQHRGQPFPGSSQSSAAADVTRLVQAGGSAEDAVKNLRASIRDSLERPLGITQHHIVNSPNKRQLVDSIIDTRVRRQTQAQTPTRTIDATRQNVRSLRWR